MVSLSLLDKHIEPILLYGSRVWGIPTSNRAVRLKLRQINTKQLKSEINKTLSVLNAGDTEIISYRYCKSRDDILYIITLYTMLLTIKAHIIANYNNFPAVIFTVSDNMNSHSEIEAFYNKYLKYAIGITKYASNTLTLLELGRFPIQIKATVSAILYWLRLAHGTENIMLNAALQTEKWQKYMVTKCTIYTLDKWLRDVWHNPERWEKIN